MGRNTGQTDPSVDAGSGMVAEKLKSEEKGLDGILAVSTRLG